LCGPLHPQILASHCNRGAVVRRKLAAKPMILIPNLQASSMFASQTGSCGHTCDKDVPLLLLLHLLHLLLIPMKIYKVGTRGTKSSLEITHSARQELVDASGIKTCRID
jgi:hypothetical protein